MRAIILAAGSGSRLGVEKEVPKLFISPDGDETIWEKQKCALEPHVDEIVVVLGYGMTTDDGLKDEKVREYIDDEDGVTVVGFPDWHNYENGRTLLRALEETEDERSLVICGDTVIYEEWVKQLIDDIDRSGRNVGLFHIEEQEEARTGGIVKGSANTMDYHPLVDYGRISGTYRSASMWGLHENQIEDVKSVLREEPDYWFPVGFIATDTCAVFTERRVWEFNTPEDLRVYQDEYGDKESPLLEQ